MGSVAITPSGVTRNTEKWKLFWNRYRSPAILVITLFGASWERTGLAKKADKITTPKRRTMYFCVINDFISTSLIGINSCTCYVNVTPVIGD
jgi:hypothetical protein